jgi:hypothetical protein
MEPTGCTEMSVTNYQSTLRNIPQKRRCQMLLCCLDKVQNKGLNKVQEMDLGIKDHANS